MQPQGGQTKSAAGTIAHATAALHFCVVYRIIRLCCYYTTLLTDCQVPPWQIIRNVLYCLCGYGTPYLLMSARWGMGCVTCDSHYRIPWHGACRTYQV